jgi:Zn-dependent protease with chaperone function
VIQALFFDGKSTVATPVALRVDGGLLHIQAAGWQRCERAESLEFTPPYARSAARVNLPDGALCEVPPGDFLGLRRALAKPPGLIELIESRWRYALLSLAVIAACVASVYVWGIPIAVGMIVERAPRTLDSHFGKSTLTQLESYGLIGPKRAATPREERLSRRFAQLAGGTAVPYQLDFRDFPAGPNAFALPDGTILMSSEIEALTQNDDALMFVLAHELGHLYYRHGVKLLARATLTSILITWYAGDVSNALALATVGVLNLRYSREAEAQADAFAIARLRAAHIPTRPAADLFRAMQKTSSKGGEGKPRKFAVEPPDYLSSHPATKDRIRLLDSDTP